VEAYCLVSDLGFLVAMSAVLAIVAFLGVLLGWYLREPR
jgi:hypothetical protein